MNNYTTTYTPLESLFLFQLLNKYGFIDTFDRISNELKETPLLVEQETYDARRLSPGSLQELALQLLRDEQRREAEAVAGKNANGLSPNSLKRKLPSPPLPSLKEAHEQPEKLPILIDRLYGQFRDIIVRAIQEDERQFEAAQRDIGEIERGDWDTRIAQQNRAIAGKNGAPVGNGLPLLPPSARHNGQIAPISIPVQASAPAPGPATPKVQDSGRRIEPTPNPQPLPEKRPAQPSPSALPPAARLPSETPQPTLDARPHEPARAANGTTPVLQHPQVAQGYNSHPASTSPQPPVAEGLQRPDTLPKGRSPGPALPNPSQNHALKWEPPISYNINNNNNNNNINHHTKYHINRHTKHHINRRTKYHINRRTKYHINRHTKYHTKRLINHTRHLINHIRRLINNLSRHHIRHLCLRRVPLMVSEAPDLHPTLPSFHLLKLNILKAMLVVDQARDNLPSSPGFPYKRLAIHLPRCYYHRRMQAKSHPHSSPCL
ncbi:Uu.00g073970.m01.CDS01 [Anthostomella pinea]|uniref:Uu.00g073970.m01.CDS01 n=1 Tax=Anthostomella pinea TaxID=933095 RepID=A0AAI8VVC8_9PEZI|nr:Uu.00g073970.m01.CDS01 [Anthostomella pinea]